MMRIHISDLVDLIETTVISLVTVAGQRRSVITVQANGETAIVVYGDDVKLGIVPVRDINNNLNSSKGFLDLLKKKLSI